MVSGVRIEDWKGVAGLPPRLEAQRQGFCPKKAVWRYMMPYQGNLGFLHKNSKQEVGDVGEGVEPGVQE